MAPLSPPPTYTKVGHFNSFQPARRLYQNDPPQKCTEEKNKTHFLQIRWFSARYTPLIHNNSTHTNTHTHTHTHAAKEGGVIFCNFLAQVTSIVSPWKGFYTQVFWNWDSSIELLSVVYIWRPTVSAIARFHFFCWDLDLWVCEVLPGCVWCFVEELEWLLYRELCRAWCALRRARTTRAPASPWKVRFRSYPRHVKM